MQSGSLVNDLQTLVLVCWPINRFYFTYCKMQAWPETYVLKGNIQPGHGRRKLMVAPKNRSPLTASRRVIDLAGSSRGYPVVPNWPASSVWRQLLGG